MKMFLKKELLKRTIKLKSDSEGLHHAKSSEHLSQDTLYLQINKDENLIPTHSNILKGQNEVKFFNSMQDNVNTPQNNKRQTAMSLDRYDSDILEIFDGVPFSDSDQSITENEKTINENLVDDLNGKRNPEILRDKNIVSQDSEDSDEDQEHSFKRSSCTPRNTSTSNNMKCDIPVTASLSNGVDNLSGGIRNSPAFSEDTLSDSDERDQRKSFMQEGPSHLQNNLIVICQSFQRNGKCNVRNCPFRHSAPLEEKNLAVVDPFDLLKNIKTCNTQEDFYVLFALVKGRISYLSLSMKSTFIVELLTSAIKFVNESNKDTLDKVFYLISEHDVWNAKLCSSCIEVCTAKRNITLDLTINIFKSCKTLQICLDSPAIQTLSYLFSTKVCDISLLIDLWEYVQSDCKRSISVDYVNFIIRFCAFNVVAEAVFKRLSNLLAGIDLGLLCYHPVKILSNKCEKYFGSPFVCLRSDQALVKQTQYLHEASTRKRIHAMVESCSWKDLADLFRLCALENNMRLVGCICEALLLQSSRLGVCYQKFADAVYVSEWTTVHEMHLLGQIGIALLLEEYEKKNFLVGYTILHSLHKYDIRYYELQQQVKSSNLDQLLKFDFKRQAMPSIVQNFDVAFAAIDICIELKRLNCAYKLLNDFDWIKLNKSSEEDVPRDVKRSEYLLKLAVKLHETDYSEKSLEVAHVLLQSVQKDSSLLDMKDITTDLVHIYNELLEFLLNKGELDEVLNFYNYSKHETLNVLEVRPCILRGLVVLHATAGLLDEAWNYFMQFVIKKVYSIPVPTVERCLILQTSWTAVELEFATKYFLNKLFPILLYKPPRVEFETWFSLRILFEKSNKESNSLTCLRINAGSVDDVVERMIHVLTSKMEPALDIETGKEPSGKIDIVPRSLYNKFCCWKKENPDEQLLETTTETFNFEGPDGAFSFGHSDALQSRSKQGQLVFQGDILKDRNDQVQGVNFIRSNLFSKVSPGKGTVNCVNGEASNANHIPTYRNSPFFIPHAPSLHQKSWSTPEPSTIHAMCSNSMQAQTLRCKLYSPQTPVLPPSASTYERNCNDNVFKKSLASSFSEQSELSSKPSREMAIQTPHKDNLNKKWSVKNTLSQKLEAKPFRPKKIYPPSTLGKPSQLVPLKLRNNLAKSFKVLTPRKNLTTFCPQKVVRTRNAKRIAANKTNMDVETFLKGISHTVCFESRSGSDASSRSAKMSVAGSSSSQFDGSQYSGTRVNVTSGNQSCSREVFVKIENFLKCKLLSQFKGVPCSDLESEARDMADAFISRNNISSSLDRKIMKQLVDYADERIKRKLKFQVPFRKM